MEYFIKTFWRPLLCWQYLLVCLHDFLIGPIITQWLTGGVWHPITLQEGAIYHVSMGGVVGVTSWTRGMEKIKELDGSNVTPDNPDEPQIPDFRQNFNDPYFKKED
jgi:hypothetical protein